MASVVSQAANLIPNSSFESGYSRGWTVYQTANNTFYGNNEFGPSLVTNNTSVASNSFHGKYAFVLPTQARLISRALWLNPSTYTFSWYGKGSGTLPFGVINEADIGGGSPPPNSAVLSGSWTRYTSTYTVTTNGRYWVKFGYGNALAQIDAVQLETGGSATAYAPQSQQEVGLSVPGKYNMFFQSDNPVFQLNAWNEGSSVSFPVNYDVYNAWNSNCLSGRVLMSLAANTNTTTTVALPSQKGWFRVVTRSTSYDKSDDEICLASLPYTTNTAYSTTSWLAGHAHSSPFLVDRDRLAFRGTERALSVNAFPLWDSVQPTGPSDFVWTDSYVTNWSNAGMQMIVPLNSVQGTWLYWATNGGGSANLSYYSNYCRLVANRMCNVLGLTNALFEMWNEPKQSGPFSGSAIDVTVATNYTKLWAAGVSGITNAYASARIVGGGGSSGEGDWVYQAYTNLPVAVQNATKYISTHIYALQDPTLLDYQDGNANQFGPWVRTFGPLGKTLLHTEGGFYDLASYHGWNAFWPDAYDLYATEVYESTRGELMNRQLVGLVRIMPTVLRGIGFGFRLFTYYDCRFFNDSTFSGSQPYGADYYQVDKPGLVSVSIAASQIAWGMGSLTNAAMFPYIEAYNYTNYSGNPIVAAWSIDEHNRTLTLTNTSFEVRDAMWNQIQTNVATVKLTRVPVYLKTTTLTLQQLSNTFCNATVVTNSDIIPPQISVDIAPSGIWSGDTNAVLIKWTAIDDTWFYSIPNAAASCTNILYRYKLDGGAYSAYSQSNHVWISNLGVGNHTLYLGAKDAANNASEVVYGFVPVGGTLNVSGTFTITGSLTVGP